MFPHRARFRTVDRVFPHRARFRTVDRVFPQRARFRTVDCVFPHCARFRTGTVCSRTVPVSAPVVSIKANATAS